MNRRVVSIIAVVAVAIVVALGASLLSSDAYAIPITFTSARNNAARSAEVINTTMNDSLLQLSEIAQYDRRGDTSSALFLIKKELAKIPQKRDEATTLAGHMEQMARAIVEIKPSSARQAALEAVSSQVAAIGHLLTYNEQLTKLFGVLENQIKGVRTTEKVQDLVAVLNTEAETINSLNASFNTSLRRFDEIFRGKNVAETE